MFSFFHQGEYKQYSWTFLYKHEDESNITKRFTHFLKIQIIVHSGMTITITVKMWKVKIQCKIDIKNTLKRICHYLIFSEEWRCQETANLLAKSTPASIEEGRPVLPLLKGTAVSWHSQSSGLSWTVPANSLNCEAVQVQTRLFLPKIPRNIFWRHGFKLLHNSHFCRILWIHFLILIL